MVNSRDVTERREDEEILRRKVEFEKTISKISSRFVEISDIDEVINVTLADMGHFTGSSRAHVFLLREDSSVVESSDSNMSSRSSS